jgi:hypothetical protein
MIKLAELQDTELLQPGVILIYFYRLHLSGRKRNAEKMCQKVAQTSFFMDLLNEVAVDRNGFVRTGVRQGLSIVKILLSECHLTE